MPVSCYSHFLVSAQESDKESGIGKALMPRSRATNAPSPMYLSRAHFRCRAALSRRDGTTDVPCCWRRLRSRRPAAYLRASGDGAGGFLRVVLRAANQTGRLPGASAHILSNLSRGSAALAPPLCRFLCHFLVRTQESENNKKRALRVERPLIM